MSATALAMDKSSGLDPSNPNIVTKREKAAICIRKIGANGANVFISSFGTAFLSDAYFANYGYNNVVTTISLINSISIVFGCLMNLVAGMVIYKARFKRGKYNPWALFTCLPVMLYGIFYFVTPTGLSFSSMIALRWVIVLFGTAVMQFVSQSENIIQVISADSSEKKKIINLNSIMAYIGYGGVYVFYYGFEMLFKKGVKAGNYVVLTYLVVAICFALIRFAGDLMTFLFCKERVPMTGEPFNLRKAGLQPMKYRPFRVYYIIQWMRALLGMTGIMITYFCQCTIGTGKIIWLTLPSAVGTVIGLLIFTKLVKKISAVRLLQIAGLYVMAMAVALVIVGYSVDWYSAVFPNGVGGETATLLPIVFYIFYFLFGFYFGFETIGYEHLKMECFDYLEWKMGKRVEAMATIVPEWGRSAFNALRNFLIPMMVGWVGFQNAINDDAGNTILTVAQNVAQAGKDGYNNTCRLILVFATIATAIAALASAGVLFLYGIDKKVRTQMYDELKENRERNRVESESKVA